MVQARGFAVASGSSGMVKRPVLTAASPIVPTVFISPGTGLTGSGQILPGNGLPSIISVSIDVTGVSAATYGSNATSPTIAVNTQGQITSASNTPISIITGTTTNDNAASGKVGEYIESILGAGSAVNLTTNTAADVTTISLTAGDWDVNGVIAFFGNVATSVTDLIAGINSTSATIPTDGTIGRVASVFPGGQTLFAVNDQMLQISSTRFSLATTTTIYLVAFATFTVNTAKAYGHIRARRIR